MARFRARKESLRSALMSPAWWETTEPLLVVYERETFGALLSFLLLDGVIKWRAAVAIGHVTALTAEKNMEDARTLMRRMMWHMNEESGNIGWGIPETMAECLVAHRGLAKEYHRILISYIRDRDGDSNYCDYAPLRRFCFWAVGRLMSARPDVATLAHEGLIAGLSDDDMLCRGYATWALGQYIESTQQHDALKSTQQITRELFSPEEQNVICSKLALLCAEKRTIELFEHGECYDASIASIAEHAQSLFLCKRGLHN